jgi:hypothetical protein
MPRFGERREDAVARLREGEKRARLRGVRLEYQKSQKPSPFAMVCFLVSRQRRCRAITKSNRHIYGVNSVHLSRWNNLQMPHSVKLTPYSSRVLPGMNSRTKPAGYGIAREAIATSLNRSCQRAVKIFFDLILMTSLKAGVFSIAREKTPPISSGDMTSFAVR